ncbi:hypothetical protein AUC68_12485 [Methyloceanibacter methanicus]|uniref:Uncharacterized protein n=1 Tax=Methyloceanibacter methanicus TaxID=1774968 RepID=A0A1E3W620_9HYPH|nr:hypothetical protein [Methyloceanibacter methanicus]ODS01180.1 hypothetical protein AUC68_12485 [Methyloceanibacter methanicus]
MFRYTILGTVLMAGFVAAVWGDAGANPACRGKQEACAALTLSEDGCKLTNNADREMQVLVFLKSGGFSSYTIPPGQTRKAYAADGCLDPAKTLANYQVVLSLPPLGGGREKTGPNCTGDSCHTVTLTKKDGCYWLQSRAGEPVVVAVKIGGKSKSYGLEAAALTPSPGHDRYAGEHGKKYDPLMQADYGTFSVKIGGPKGCIADKNKIDTYAANAAEDGTAVAGIANLLSTSAAGAEEAAAPEKPKGKAKHSPMRPCSGNACDVLFAERGRLEQCKILNGGQRPIKVRVTQRSGGDWTFRSVAPGVETRMSTPLGCVAVDDIASFEANYVK